MKKYLQYNQNLYRDTQQSDLSSAQKNLELAAGNAIRSPGALDLSGKQRTSTPGSANKPQWTNEQDIALDLSGYTKQQDQNEALDLSKPAVSKPDHQSKVSYPQGPPAQRVVSTPPPSRHSRSPAGQQYSLLQAALNSSLPNAGLQPFESVSQSNAGVHPAFETISQSTALLLQQRALNFTTAGLTVGDFSRAIKPFNTMSSRPLGFSMLQGPHAAGAVIQGVHKPIAITTPQPHNSSTDTKSQSVSISTVSVTDANHSVSSTTNQGFNVSQANYSTSGYHTQPNKSVNPRKLSGSDIKRQSMDSVKEHDGHVERYIIQPPDGLNHHFVNSNMHSLPTQVLPAFSCNQCPKTFKTKAALKLHTTVHKTSEERQYGCSICNRRFLHRHHLVVHQRKHSGEKPFKCNACSKTFMAIFLLHKHLRKHARETGPISQISVDQLKQLHDKKLISEGSEPLPFLSPGPGQEKAPVIILDDDEGVNATVEIKINDVGKFDTILDDKDKKILEILGNNQKLILDKLKADLLTKNKTKEIEPTRNTNNVNAKVSETNEKNVCDVELKAETEIQKPSVSECSGKPTIVMEETNDTKSDKDDIGEDYNYILKDSEDDSKDVSVSNDSNDQSNPCVQAESDLSFELSKEGVKPDPIPEYGSDDEIELDCITGEIRVIGKKKVEEDIVVAMETTENKANEQELKDNDIEMKEKDTEMKEKDTEMKEKDMGMKENDMRKTDKIVESGIPEETVKEVVESLVKQTADSVNNAVVKVTDMSTDSDAVVVKKEKQHNATELVATDVKINQGDGISENIKMEVIEETVDVNQDCEGSADDVMKTEEKVMISSEKVMPGSEKVVQSSDKAMPSSEKVMAASEKLMPASGNKNDELIVEKNEDEVVKVKNVDNGETLMKESSTDKADLTKDEPEGSKPMVSESRNIFDKITQMKDMKDFKSGRADKEFVDKEVEIILRNIKRVVCKDESLTNVESKKPKLCGKNDEDNPEIMPTLSAESVVKSTSMDTESGTVSKSKQTKGKKKSRKVKCEVCSRSFHSNHYLLLHMAVHKRGSMLQSLKKAKDYQLKAMGFVNKSNVTCEVCKKVFKFQRSLNSHMRVHSEKLIQTKLYRKSYRDFMAEAAPQNSRNSEKDKSQVVMVSDSIENESHLGHCSEGEQEKTSVPTISKCASARSSLGSVKASDVTEEVDDEPPIKVIIGSDNIKRYLCHACDNTYTTKQKLRMHALIHKDNCYLCDICGKSFFRQITLEKHITTHKLPRPHVCDICKKTFIHRSSLMRHKVAHEKAATPGLKQQVADRNFEMKMLDTYSMLKQERMQQKLQQMQQRNEHPEQISLKTLNKYDALDLSVKIKPEDTCLPPVLSPVIANFTNSTHSIPCNLSPPLITQEGRASYDKTPEKLDSRLSEGDHSMIVSQVMDQASVSHVGEKRKPRTDSTCSESDIVAVEGHKVVQKRVRKTRVYPTSCRVCKEVFPNVMLLKSHMAVHNTVETHLYECHICRHRFTQSCSLLRHLKTSCQENKMKCIPCGRTFHRRNTFEQHMRLHQIGPPNLDGSFYDKRPDEVAMHEERESDIENNNLSKIHKTVVTTQELNTNMLPQQPLTLKIIDVVSKSEPNATEYNCDDSDDARTYLYSEGEVHSRYNSDFSDNDWSPPQSPKKIAAPQDLSMSSASMTLNLLSAVCSDIRNAEKEKELKQQELEEKQKELETIEILANLKRGAMQKSMSPAPVLPLADRVNNPSTVPLSVYDSIVNSVSYHHSHSYPRDSNKSVANPRNQKPITSNKSDSFKHVVSSSGYAASPSALVSPLPNNQYHPSVNYPSNKHRASTMSESSVSRVGEQKIPTVVLEVAANAETQNKQPGPSHRTWSGRSASVPSLGEPIISKDGNLTPDVSQTKIAYPAIQERLSLLMKAQVSASLAGNTVTVHDSQNLPISCIPSLNAANFRPHVSPGRHFPSHTQTFTDAPQDLTVKKSPVMTPVSSSNQAKTTHQPLLSHVVSPNIINNATATEPYLKPLSKDKQKQNHDIPRSNSSRSLPSDLSRSNQGQGEGQRQTESVPAPPPPPLVPMFHCELCSRVLYSKTDLHLHMMEHGRSAGALFKMLHNNQLLAAGKKPLSQDSPIDFTKPGPSSSGASPADVKNPVPTSLDLPSKVTDKSKELSTPPVSRPMSIEQLIQPVSRSMSIESLIQPASRSMSMESLTSSVPRSLPESPGSQLKSFMSSAPKISETLSPVTSSDFSDSHSLPSPSTPSAPGTPGTPTANLDMLRQELRLKIYARRRSQGLDDLKVEFKQPEPTEMTEAEKVKLLYRRECNRQAAQRSRMRKKDLVDSLLEKLSEMPNVNPKVQKTEKADP